MDDKYGWYSPTQEKLNGYHYVYKDFFNKDVYVTNINYNNQFRTCLFTDSKCVGPIYKLVKKSENYKIEKYIKIEKEKNDNIPS